MKNRNKHRFKIHHIDDIYAINDMDELIEYAYELFNHYKPHKPLEVCTFCCMYEYNIPIIYKTPIHELSRDVIYDYLYAACTGTEESLSDEIRYFVPRIFELLNKGENLRMSTEITLDKFHLELGVWSDKEVAVFRRFGELYFKSILTKYDDDKFRHIEIFNTIMMFYHAGLRELDVFFDILLKSLNNDITLLNLCSNIYWRLCNGYKSAFSDGAFNQMVDEWINDKHVKNIISQKILALTQKNIYQNIDDEQRYWVDVAFDKVNE